jgi:DNA polymerase-3 subunit gamma/tau
MSYLVLARKWRPQRFDEVVGQQHVTRTLRNAIEMDRVAHAFLFAGVRGVGKTSLARILAKSLNCQDGPTVDPCGECESCRSVTGGTAVDVIEIDGASNNSVDDVRDLRETVPYRPQLGRFKIYVIDEVHMLSVSAFNALLKTLEEPPPHVKFIFATTEPHKIPTTILSRCQRYDFRRIPTAAIVERIRQILADEGIEADAGALSIIGREAEGSMRDALSILDQVLASGVESISAEVVTDLLGVVARQVFYDLSAALLAGDPRRCLEVIREVDLQGFDIPTFARGLLEHLRNLVVAGVCGDDQTVLDLPDEEARELRAQAAEVGGDTLHRLFKHFSEAYDEIARSSHPRILLETTLARLADRGALLPAAELIERLERLEGGRPAPSGGGGGGGRSRGSGGPGHGPRGGGGGGQRTAQSATPVPSAPPTNASAEPPPQPTEPAAERTPAPGPTDWSALLEELSRENPAIASVIERGAAAPDRGDGVLVLRFDRHDRFAATLAQDRGRQQELARFLGERRGSPVRVEVELTDQADLSAAARRKIEQQQERLELEDEARRHPLVRGALTEFGGKISRVQVRDEPGESGN